MPVTVLAPSRRSTHQHLLPLPSTPTGKRTCTGAEPGPIQSQPCEPSHRGSQGSAVWRGHWAEGPATHRKGVLIHIAVVGCAHEDGGHVLHILHIDCDCSGGGEYHVGPSQSPSAILGENQRVKRGWALDGPRWHLASATSWPQNQLPSLIFVCSCVTWSSVPPRRGY